METRIGARTKLLGTPQVAIVVVLVGVLTMPVSGAQDSDCADVNLEIEPYLSVTLLTDPIRLILTSEDVAAGKDYACAWFSAIVCANLPEEDFHLELDGQITDDAILANGGEMGFRWEARAATCGTLWHWSNPAKWSLNDPEWLWVCLPTLLGCDPPTWPGCHTLAPIAQLGLSGLAGLPADEYNDTPVGLVTLTIVADVAGDNHDVDVNWEPLPDPVLSGP